ncbi:MAG: peptidoglycan DD-metalloendopeptidase family protein [Deltaproteobacteria bacterium]|nr:peptidoglycan DD-metalloendopeptidase family protein [Deltaproteobacteria bacterium]
MRWLQPPDPKRRIALLLAFLSIFGTSLYFLTKASLDDTASPFVWKQPTPRPPPDTDPLQKSLYIVKKGDSLFNILRAYGVPGGQIDLVAKSVRMICDRASLCPGNAVKIWLSRENPVRLVRMNYEIDGLNELEVSNEDGVFTARKRTHVAEVRLAKAQGRIKSNLYESAVGAGLPHEIVMDLTDIFAWDINFFTDIREGDSFTILYEEYYVEEVFKGYGKIVAASFINQGEERTAIRYRDAIGSEGYYDAEGRPIRKLFLKAPLNFRRISSGFTGQRLHPIFQVMKPHLGVDYAAPSGTPVVSLGKGTVLFKGWSNGFGKCVQIHHPSGHVTHYGHLSRFAGGLARGSRVDQGEVIGYVGSTGISTGPHLDFRVELKGKFINPLALGPVNSPPLHQEALNRFRDLAVERVAMLNGPRLRPDRETRAMRPAAGKRLSVRPVSDEAASPGKNRLSRAPKAEF